MLLCYPLKFGKTILFRAFLYSLEVSISSKLIHQIETTQNRFTNCLTKVMLKRANELLEKQQYQDAVDEYTRVISTNPDKSTLTAAYYNRANAQDQLGHYAEAAQSYQRIVQLDPNFQNGDIYWEQGQLYQLARMNVPCKNAYLKYLKIHPEHPECNFNLGKMLQNLGEQQEAIKCFERAYQTKPNFSKAYISKIAILKKLNRQEEILKTCGRALKYEPTDFQLRYEEGLAFSSLKQFKSAAESLRECLSYNKKFVRAYISLGDAYYKLDKDNEALSILQNCLKDNKDVIKIAEKKEIKILIGTIYINLKQYRKAIDCFQQVLSQKPILESVKAKLAFCLEEEGNNFFQKKQFSDALTYYSQASKYESNKTSLLNNTGLAYQNINNFADAERCFKEAIKREPNNTIALNHLASLYSTRGRVKEAEQIFSKIAKENPDNAEIVHINNGKHFMTIHKYAEAYQQYLKAEKKQSNNANLLNDMAVALDKMQRFQQALSYADAANKLTNQRSPLMLLNRAAILMNLKMVGAARIDFERAAEQLRNPDKSNLRNQGISLQNLKFIYGQLDHYAYLMNPIDLFKEGLKNEVFKLGLQKEQLKMPKVVQKVEKAEQYALFRVMNEINKEGAKQPLNPEQSRMDLNVVEKMINDATRQMKEQIQNYKSEVKVLKKQLEIVKRESKEIKELLLYLPQSIGLRKKLDQLYSTGDIGIWQYGKQLYWILNGYLTGYMLIKTGVVAKGENINRSIFSRALDKIKGILEFSQNIPIIGQFSQLIGKVCGLFVDMEDEAIIEKVFEIISFNYDTQEVLNDAVCETILLFLNNKKKIEKVREKLIFKPAEGFFDKLEQTVDEVSTWFSQKKNEFIIHMRGFEKAENIIQSELAVVDAGVLISILLNFESNSKQKFPVLTNAAKKALADEQVEKMVLSAYQRENQSLRVSNNGFCLVMRCQIIYDNPILNDPAFFNYAKGKVQNINKAILNAPSKIPHVELCNYLRSRRYSQLLHLLCGELPQSS